MKKEGVQRPFFFMLLNPFHKKKERESKKKRVEKKEKGEKRDRNTAYRRQRQRGIRDRKGMEE